MTAAATRVARDHAKKLDASESRARFAAETEAKARRAAADDLIRRAFCESMSRRGYVDQDIANACRTKRQHVEEWRSGRKGRLPSMSHVLCMPTDLRDDMLHAFAAAAGRGVVDPTAATGDVLAAVADLDRHSSEARCATLMALADGHESLQDLVTQRREYQDVVDGSMGQVARCDREIARLRGEGQR